VTGVADDHVDGSQGRERGRHDLAALPGVGDVELGGPELVTGLLAEVVERPEPGDRSAGHRPG